MNDVLKAIESRRSVRRYHPEQIRDEDLESIIRAGLSAPSAKNQQPWHLTVIRSKEMIDELAAKVKASLANAPEDWRRAYGNNKKFHVFYEAPVVILVSLEKDAISPLADGSAAIQNMLLAAESLGIGSCWVGMVSSHFTDLSHNDEFGIPHSHQPRYAVTLGFQAGEKGKAPARRTNTVNYLQ
ncbi:MAG: nitroreductase family protein [Spirochaetota bacterium]